MLKRQRYKYRGPPRDGAGIADVARKGRNVEHINTGQARGDRATDRIRDSAGEAGDLPDIDTIATGRDGAGIVDRTRKADDFGGIDGGTARGDDATVTDVARR